MYSMLCHGPVKFSSRSFLDSPFLKISRRASTEHEIHAEKIGDGDPGNGAVSNASGEDFLLGSLGKFLKTLRTLASFTAVIWKRRRSVV